MDVLPDLSAEELGKEINKVVFKPACRFLGNVCSGLYKSARPGLRFLSRGVQPVVEKVGLGVLVMTSLACLVAANIIGAGAATITTLGCGLAGAAMVAGRVLPLAEGNDPHALPEPLTAAKYAFKKTAGPLMDKSDSLHIDVAAAFGRVNQRWRRWSHQNYS